MWLFNYFKEFRSQIFLIRIHKEILVKIIKNYLKRQTQILQWQKQKGKFENAKIMHSLCNMFESKPLPIHQLSDTRWSCKYLSIKAIEQNYTIIINILEQLTQL